MDKKIGMYMVGTLLLLVRIHFKSKALKSNKYYKLVQVNKDKHRPGIEELARHTYGGHDWIVDAYDSWFEPDAHCIVIGYEHIPTGDLAALYVMRPNLEDKNGCLEALRVHPRHRGRKLAHSIQDEMIRFVRSRKSELGLNLLRYTVYDENVASVKVAKQSGMEIKHEFCYFMVTEDEATSDNDFLAWRGIGAMERFFIYVQTKLASSSPTTTTSSLFTKLTSPMDIQQRLVSMGCKILYHDWKPYDITERNLYRILTQSDTECYCLNDGMGGISMGAFRTDHQGVICVLTCYWWTNGNSENDDERGRVAAIDVLKHLNFWAEKCRARKATALCTSYPMIAHKHLFHLGIPKRQHAQREYVLELTI